mmetsp:Transcript_30674/g.71334  ORF Transcript_30674/g.71334 Transcript_30674/m.71334 type:complete len:292 (+) Transcript_30674:885-1760(+)
MHHLCDCRIGERLVQQVERVAQLDGVDQVVLLARRDLHEADESAVRAVRMLLEVNADLRDGCEPLPQRRQTRLRVDPYALRQMHWAEEGHLDRRRQLRLGRLERADLVLVGVRICFKRRRESRRRCQCGSRLQHQLQWDESIGLGTQLGHERPIRVVDLLLPSQLRAARRACTVRTCWHDRGVRWPRRGVQGCCTSWQRPSKWKRHAGGRSRRCGAVAKQPRVTTHVREPPRCVELGVDALEQLIGQVDHRIKLVGDVVKGRECGCSSGVVLVADHRRHHVRKLLRNPPHG